MTPEFSHPVAVEELPTERETRVTLVADADSRAALAGRFDLMALETLEAELVVRVEAGGFFRVTGTYNADVIQTCVVTLAPVDNHVEGEVERLYALESAMPEEPPRGHDLDAEHELEAEDPPDPVEQGHIDLGEAVAEQLALDLDPFPRAPGAAFEPPESAPGSEPARDNPFAVLAKLKEKGN